SQGRAGQDPATSPPYLVDRPSKIRAARRHVAVARSGLCGAYPECIKPACSQMEAEANALAGEPRDIRVLCPGHAMERLVFSNRDAACQAQGLDHFTFFVQDFDAQFALARIDVDEKMSALEAHGSRRQSAFVLVCIHRGEAIPAQDCQARASHAGRRRAPDASPAADVKVEPVADYQAAAAGRLDIAPVPVAVLFRNRDERAMVGPVPVKPIAAETDAHLVRLGPIFRLSAPDRE